MRSRMASNCAACASRDWPETLSEWSPRAIGTRVTVAGNVARIGSSSAGVPKASRVALHEQHRGARSTAGVPTAAGWLARAGAADSRGRPGRRSARRDRPARPPGARPSVPPIDLPPITSARSSSHPLVPHRGNHLAIAGLELWRRVGHLRAPLHVGKVEGHRRQPACREPARAAHHERMVLPRPCAMREHQQRRPFALRRVIPTRHARLRSDDDLKRFWRHISSVASFFLLRALPTSYLFLSSLFLVPCSLFLVPCSLRLVTCDLRLATCDLRLATCYLLLLPFPAPSFLPRRAMRCWSAVAPGSSRRARCPRARGPALTSRRSELLAARDQQRDAARPAGTARAASPAGRRGRGTSSMARISSSTLMPAS